MVVKALLGVRHAKASKNRFIPGIMLRALRLLLLLLLLVLLCKNENENVNIDEIGNQKLFALVIKHN